MIGRPIIPNRRAQNQSKSRIWYRYDYSVYCTLHYKHVFCNIRPGNSGLSSPPVNFIAPWSSFAISYIKCESTVSFNGTYFQNKVSFAIELFNNETFSGDVATDS